MNLDDLINRAIEVAQSSAAARRDAALQVAKLNADTQSSIADKTLEGNRLHADTRLQAAQLGADATKYNADLRLRAQEIQSESQRYSADSHLLGQTYSADRNLLGHVVTAGAQAKRADVEAAMPTLRGMSTLLSGVQTPGDGATKAERDAANQKNSAIYSGIEALKSDPAYQSAMTPYDPATTVGGFLRSAPQHGVSLRTAQSPAFGSQQQPATPIATQRTPSALGGSPDFSQPRQATPPLVSPSIPRLMDPSRILSNKW